MDAFLHQLLSGLATGGIYASMALALVMIYQSTHHINFAQGEMAMFSTYLAWTLVDAGMPYWIAFVATLAISFVAGVVIERIIVRPVEHAPVLSVVIVFIALLVILDSVADEVSRAAPRAIYGAVLLLFIYVAPGGVAALLRRVFARVGDHR